MFSSDASQVFPKSSSRSSTAALSNAAYGSANAEAPGASVRAEPEEKRRRRRARRRRSAAGFGPPVAANPFAAAAKAAARTSAHRAEPLAGPAGTPEVRSAPRLGTAHVSPRVAPAQKSRARPSRVPGLVNLGNTCYLAATAQLLCGLDAFAGDVDGLPDAYLNALNANACGSTPEGTGGGDARGDAPSFDGVAGAARDLVRKRKAHAARFDDAKTRASATAAIVPARLKRATQRRHSRYEGYEQHDAHEFLCDALDALAEEVAVAERPRNVSGARTDASGPVREWVPLHRTRCPTRRAFTGASAVTLTCETCGDASTSVESFRHLSLEIPPSETFESAPLELQGLIARCFASETVERRCARAGCGGTRAAMARRLLRARARAARAPQALPRRRRVARDVRRRAFFAVSLGRLATWVLGERVRAPALDEGRATDHASGDGHARAVRGRGGSRAPDGVGGDGRRRRSIRQPRGPRSLGGRGGGGDAHVRRRRIRGGRGARARSSRRIGSRGWSRTWGHPCAGATTSRARVDSGGEDENGFKTAAKRWMSFDDERASFAGSPAASASAAGDWYVAAFECEAAR